ncbi:MAG: pitrilysin family protein [Patescibacteria group bacterium]
MKYKLERFSNGPRLLMVPLPNMESSTVTVWVKTGSRLESPETSGISHFLEHMVFKGSKKRPTAKEIALAVDSIGGEFNAGTSKEWTNFYIRTRNELFPTALDVLSDMVLNPILKAEDIEREKGVIIEEIAMYEDTPMLKIGETFESLVFKGNPLEKDVGGTKNSVRKMDRSDFVNYRKMHYGANNVLITVVGGFEQREVEGLVKKYFKSLKRIKREKIVKFNSNQKKPAVLLHSKKKEQAHFILGFLGSQTGSKDRFTESVIAGILGRGMSSRLFTEIREKRGLAYDIRTLREHYLDTGYIGTYAGVDVKRVDEAIKVILDEHYKLASGKKKISANELKKAKEYLKGHLALSLEDPRNISSFFGLKELLLDKTETPEDVFKGIDEVSKEDILRVAKKLFVPERLNLAVIGPYKDKRRFEKIVS